jgi:type I restriction enzyme S subunit
MRVSGSWPEVALGDVVSSLGGLWGEAGPVDGHVEVLALRGTDFTRARALDLSGVPRRFEKAKAVGKRVLDTTSVVMEASGGSKDQPVGRSILIKQKLLDRADVPLSAASFCKILWVDEAFADARFIHAALDNLYRSGEIERFQTQSTGLRNLRTKQLLAEFQFGLPPIHAQRRIAAVLSAFDELIEINERRIELLEGLARSLYREWFVHFRFPGHENVELVDSGLGPIPEGWEVRRLGSLVTLHSRSTRPADQPGTIFEHFSIPAFDAGALPAMDPGAAIKSAKYRVEAESVLLSKINPRIPRVWFVQPRSVDAIASTEFLIWVGVDVSNAWLWSLFWDGTFRATLLGSAGGTSTSHQRFKPGDVAGRSVSFPSATVLEAFDSLAEPALRQAASIREHNRQLAATRDLLLPRLVTGRLDISDVDLGVLTPTEAE